MGYLMFTTAKFEVLQDTAKDIIINGNHKLFLCGTPSTFAKFEVNGL